MTTPANPLIAPRVDSTKPFSGIFILEDLDTIEEGIKNNSWIEKGLGGIAFTLDGLSAIANPLEAAASWATAYMIEHIQPLSDALEALAGDADQIDAFARTWDNVSNAIKSAGEELRSAIDRETLDWTGAAAEAYRQHMNEELGAMVTLVKAASLLGTAVKAGGLLIAFVRQLVRDLIAQAVGAVVGALPLLLAEEGLTLGLATPAVIAQVGILIGKWITRIEHDLTLLIKSLRNLGRLVTRLDEVLKTLVSLIKGLAREKPHGAPHPPHVEPPRVDPPHVEPPPVSTPPGEPVPNQRQKEILEEFEEAQRKGAQGGEPLPGEEPPGFDPDEPGRMSELDPGPDPRQDPTWERPDKWQLPAASKGEWEPGGTPGDSRWTPHNPGEYGLQPGDSIPFHEGVPDLTEHTVPTPTGEPGTFDVHGMTGDSKADFRLADEELARRTGMTPAQIEAWRVENRLTYHHYGGDELQIVPRRLHGALGHQGSASEL